MGSEDNHQIVKWADKAMFEAAPMQKDAAGEITPQVYLVSATPDPLGAVAAACLMYEGIPVYSMDDITDEQRIHYWDQSIATHLKAPWEFIDLHFFIEGVTRGFTHQMVRQRTAVFAQESMRFAVKDNMADEVPLPPSLRSPFVNKDLVESWKSAVKGIEVAYNNLVGNGIPAEDARGLLPTSVTTRLNYKTNLRGLIEHAGSRLCTQAQFEWRSVFYGIVKSIRDYGGVNGWQYEMIAKSEMFRPVCFSAGKCPFKATFDRGCTIRERADAGEFDKIAPQEWMMDPSAGVSR